MARSVRKVRGKHVLTADVAKGGFLVADDLSIKRDDSTQSTSMDPDGDMDEADDIDYSVQTDNRSIRSCHVRSGDWATL